MKDGTVGLIALAVGCTVTVAAIVTYEAWWTIAFAVGGAAVAIFERRGHPPARSTEIGAAIAGAVVLSGMALFLFYGGISRGGTTWLAASAGSAALAIVLIVIARNRLASRSR